jgi:hypothetical protein
LKGRKCPWLHCYTILFLASFVMRC